MLMVRARFPDYGVIIPEYVVMAIIIFVNFSKTAFRSGIAGYYTVLYVLCAISAGVKRLRRMLLNAGTAPSASLFRRSSAL
jgi:hypothetical protein